MQRIEAGGQGVLGVGVEDRAAAGGVLPRNDDAWLTWGSMRRVALPAAAI
jgi:hypothetical protein